MDPEKEETLAYTHKVIGIIAFAFLLLQVSAAAAQQLTKLAAGIEAVLKWQCACCVAFFAPLVTTAV
jgi:hypothetical protein